MRNERGSILIFSYLVVASMVAWGAAAMARSLSEQRTSQRYTRLASAFQTAEAGLDQALVELEADADWDGETSVEVPNGGYYDVAVDEDASGYTKLTTTGHYPTPDRCPPDETNVVVGYQCRRIEAMVDLQTPSVFQFGLFGHESIKIEDDVTIDSYDSSQGAYEDQEPGQNGDIGTNNTEEESVVLEAEDGGEITINGQVVVGLDMSQPDDAVKIEGNVTISADPDVASQSNAMELPAVSVPAECKNMNVNDYCNGDGICGDGETLPLDENTDSCYNFTSLKLEGTGAITVTGNVTVYTGDLQVENDATVNANGKPTQLLFKITSANEVKLENNGVFVGAIYAPDSLIKLENNVILYGSVVGNEVKVENATAIHYDKVLSTVGPSNGEPSEAFLLSWREL